MPWEFSDNLVRWGCYDFSVWRRSMLHYTDSTMCPVALLLNASKMTYEAALYQVWAHTYTYISNYSVVSDMHLVKYTCKN